MKNKWGKVMLSKEYFVKDQKVYEYDWEHSQDDKGAWRRFQQKMSLDGCRWITKDNEVEKAIIENFINQKSKQMNTSKVKQVTANGTWDSSYGTMFRFEYFFEDGTIVNANHKTAEGAFDVGTLVEYEITNAQYNNGKVRKPMEEQGSHQGQPTQRPFVDNTKGMKIGHAITNAVNLHVALGSSDPVMDMKESIKEYAEMVYQISDELNQEL
jgi:hypothetical protein